ncbi:protein OCTOPUS-like [Cannabis sativa]|uniref:protein OCTOPUS-like n=1 Tax=Cannabis sativa TaxID=3483 RepID=UPI0029C9EAC7|nr:protein OCTOPUS-like [Cannabis sativa]XP_060963650.1 protein OCTOPUS-like [Cannabis sativa]
MAVIPLQPLALAQAQSRRLSTCHRHPSIPITGFCASCLRERLVGIEASVNNDTPTRNQAGSGSGAGAASSSGSELRRSKSCNGPKSEVFANPSDPTRRRSCDVRARNSLYNLFNLDDERKGTAGKFEVELGNLRFELKEEDRNGNEGEIRVSEHGLLDEEDGCELRPMKEFIDLECKKKKKGTGKDLKDIAGTFWVAASGLSKKLRKWGRKPKGKKLNNDDDNDGGVLGVERCSPRHLRETQSEVGDYGLGRRSCDTDPRLSMDAGRMSLDEYRYSFDEPRASWDGYLIGRAAYPRLTPMVSVVEDTKLSDGENESCVSDTNLVKDGEMSPGGTAQTKDYYNSESLPLQRRRRSFDCSNSLHRKGGLAEVDDLKLNSNAKVSPATTELFFGAKLLITNRDLRDAKLKSVKDESLESVESTSSKDAADSVPPIGRTQKGLKKSQGWQRKWNLWGLNLMQKQRSDQPKCGLVNEEDILVGGNVADPTVPNSWENLRRVANGETNGSVSQKLIRSYSVSCRKPTCKIDGLLSNPNAGGETRGISVKKREDFSLQRNRSARYSPNHVDNNGLLRFYLTPLRSYRRSQSGKSRLKNTHSMAKNVL